MHQQSNMSGMDRTGNIENPNLQMELLELAGRSLDMRIVSDASSSSFIEVLLCLWIEHALMYCYILKLLFNFQSTSAAAQSGPTVSGLNDFDYQNLAGLVMGHQNLSQLKTVGKIPLPPEVMEHFGRMLCFNSNFIFSLT